jgi:hypothetical protein
MLDVVATYEKGVVDRYSAVVDEEEVFDSKVFFEFSLELLYKGAGIRDPGGFPDLFQIGHILLKRGQKSLRYVNHNGRVPRKFVARSKSISNTYAGDASSA